ncbi:MAG TPA: DNA translocase FtsK [Chloroflexota bacterium]|nr:DNA translocase FtsK [Chloroflexota bacterium]
MAGRRAGRKRARPRPLSAALQHWAAANWPLGLAVLLVGSGGVLGLAVLFPGGSLATLLHEWQRRALGWAAPLLALWLTAAGAAVLWWHLRPDARLPLSRVVGAVGATVALLGLTGLYTHAQPEPAAAAQQGHGGGVVGLLLARLLAGALGPMATGVLLAALLAGGLLLALRVTPAELARGLRAMAAAAWRLGMGGARLARAIRRAPAAPATAEALPAPAPAEAPAARAPARRAPARPAAAHSPTAALPEGPLAPPSPRSPWRLPPLSLLAPPASPQVSAIDLQARARIIEETLESFNISARVVEINEGPTVTQFGVEPAMGVTVSRILARQNDLALRLGATSLRMEAPVPGKRVVGIEVPNAAKTVVTLREILAAPEFERLGSPLSLALGRDVAGRPVVADLAKMPHLLIAGSTGSGKSVCLNGLIACLLMQCTPADLHLLLIDPKTIELTPYEGIPHLRLPVVTDMDKVVGVLKWALGEMERRYGLFAKHHVRHLAGYNELVARGELPEARRLPYLVLVIDELADLMMTAPDEVETSIARLAQKARAAGIHLILATQRPSVDVVTGLIKANFPTRIAFAVSAQVDSRVILDMPGAERLLGRGDMLYLSAEAAKPQRVQGTFVSDAEITALVSFWREQGPAQYDPEAIAAVESLGSGRDEGGDDLVERAAALAQEHTRISVSLLQRRLGIGYPRAARLMDTLAARGIVRPSEDGKSWVAARPAEPPPPAECAEVS